MSTVTQPHDAAHGATTAHQPWTPTPQQTAEQLADGIALFRDMLALDLDWTPPLRRRLSDTLDWMVDLHAKATAS